jgi:hypothetical protein
LAISHGGLLDEEDISRVFELATGVLVNTILAKSSLRSGNSNTVGSQLLERLVPLDTTNSQGIRQGIDKAHAPTLEQV